MLGVLRSDQWSVGARRTHRPMLDPNHACAPHRRVPPAQVCTHSYRHHICKPNQRFRVRAIPQFGVDGDPRSSSTPAPVRAEQGLSENVWQETSIISQLRQLRSVLASGTVSVVAMALLLGGCMAGVTYAETIASKPLYASTSASKTVSELRLTTTVKVVPDIASTDTQAASVSDSETQMANDLQVVEDVFTVIDQNFLPSRGRTFDRAQWGEMMEKIRQNPPTSRSAAYGSIRTMLASLNDPYTRFVSPGDFQAMSKYDITGIGLNLTDAPDSNSGVRILGLINESSSALAGARQGDEVLEVDGTSTIGLSAYQTAERIQVYHVYTNVTSQTACSNNPCNATLDIAYGLYVLLVRSMEEGTLRSSLRPGLIVAKTSPLERSLGTARQGTSKRALQRTYNVVTSQLGQREHTDTRYKLLKDQPNTPKGYYNSSPSATRLAYFACARVAPLTAFWLDFRLDGAFAGAVGHHGRSEASPRRRRGRGDQVHARERPVVPGHEPARGHLHRLHRAQGVQRAGREGGGCRGALAEREGSDAVRAGPARQRRGIGPGRQRGGQAVPRGRGRGGVHREPPRPPGGGVPRQADRHQRGAVHVSREKTLRRSVRTPPI
eukprot:1132711-Prorocentrum_minimum.AAC.1